MPDLHGWITQQIDEAERLARRAAALCGCHPPAPSWSFRDGDEPGDGRILVVDEPHPGLKRKIGRRWSTSYEGLFMAEHIVRHDPAAVLRRCAADRKILREHQPRPDGTGFPDSMHCRTCSQDGGDGYQYLVPYPCPTVLAVADGYGHTEEQP